MTALPPARPEAAGPAPAATPAAPGGAFEARTAAGGAFEDRAIRAIARATEASEGVRRLVAGAPAWAWSAPGRLFRAEAAGRVWTAGVCGDRVVVALREDGARTCAEVLLPPGWDR